MNQLTTTDLFLATLCVLLIALFIIYLGDCTGRAMKKDYEQPFNFGNADE